MSIVKKTIFFSFLAILFLYSACFAQGQPEEAAVETKQLKTFEGKVGLVVLEDVYGGSPATIKVVDENGQRLIFIIERRKTSIIGKDGSPIALAKIKEGDSVVIEYFMASANNKMAKTIKLVKSGTESF